MGWSSMHGRALLWAWPAGCSFCMRSSWARQAQLRASKSLRLWRVRSVPCDSLSLSDGPSTHWATSLATSCSRFGRPSESDLQRCRLCEQNLVLLGHLERSEERNHDTDWGPGRASDVLRATKRSLLPSHGEFSA